MYSDPVSVEDFELLKVLGKGSFGKVFLVRLISNSKVYAMKVRDLQGVRVAECCELRVKRD